MNTINGYEVYPDGPDECIEREEDNYGRSRRCTCGALDAFECYQNDPRGWGDSFPWEAFDGCRGCDPVDPELKPHGFGIELFEDERRLFAGRVFHPSKSRDAICNGWLTESLWKAEREAATSVSLRRLKHSDLVWERLCNDCETHREAVRRYKAWARRSLTVKYRDEGNQR